MSYLCPQCGMQIDTTAHICQASSGSSNGTVSYDSDGYAFFENVVKNHLQWRSLNLEGRAELARLILGNQ